MNSLEGGTNKFGLARSVVSKLRESEHLQDDIWPVDGKTSSNGGNYETTFHSHLMEGFHVRSFDELVKGMSEAFGRPIVVADIMGGGYFLNTLDDVEKMIAVRRKDNSEDLAQDISGKNRFQHDVRDKGKYFARFIRERSQDEKYNAVEGNIYDPATLLKIKEAVESTEAGLIDLIVCRPQGPFGINYLSPSVRASRMKDVQEYIMAVHIKLLYRMVEILSFSGIIFTQLPGLHDLIDEHYLQSDQYFRFVDEMRKRRCSVQISTSDFYNINLPTAVIRKEL